MRANRKQQIIGPWRKICLIDEGGNSRVWQAQDSEGRTIALKILKEQDPRAESYKRFLNEVEILRRLGNRNGILPIIEANIASPPLWFAMPIAVRVRDALGSSPALESVVEAVVSFADTLADLVEVDTYHRDIKPANLFKHNDQWVIGDFGLAAFPGKESLTGTTRQIGARNFTAPEMIDHPDTAAGGPADVYSLAKTLWVLATGQTWPPPGPQRIEDASASLSGYIFHPRMRLLDALIEKATQNEPNVRLSMKGMAAELHAWSTPMPDSATPKDLSLLTSRLQAVIEPGRREAERWSRNRQEMDRIAEQIKVQMQPFVKQAQALGLGLKPYENTGGQMFNRAPFDNVVRLIPEWREGQGDIDIRYTFSQAAELPRPATVSGWIQCGLRLELFKDDLIQLIVGYFVFVSGLSQPHGIWYSHHIVPFGLPQMYQAVAEMSNGLVKELAPSMEHFLTLLETQPSRA
jgi:serine/threonine protein kinase